MSNTMPDTMAEAFCEEYLITWTEHGQDFTSWLHKDISTRSNRMSRAGALNLFHPDGGWPPADRDRVPGPVVDRPSRTHGRRPAHPGNQRGRTPHPGHHPPGPGDLAGTPHQEDLDGRGGRLGPGQTNEPAGTPAETRDPGIPRVSPALGIPRVSGRAPGATATQPTQQEKPASPWRRPS